MLRDIAAPTASGASAAHDAALDNVAELLVSYPGDLLTEGAWRVGFVLEAFAQG